MTARDGTLTWCDNDKRYKQCQPDCFLYDECHPKKVMNVEIPVDVDRDSFDVRVDDSIDENFVPSNMVDKERVEQMRSLPSASKYKLVYKTQGSPSVVRSIRYSDVSDATRMGEYMKEKKFSEGTPIMVLKDGVPFLQWSMDGKSWVSVPRPAPGRAGARRRGF